MTHAELRSWQLSTSATMTYEAVSPAESDALPDGTLVFAMIDAPRPKRTEGRLARLHGPEIVLVPDGRRIARVAALVLGPARSVTIAL